MTMPTFGDETDSIPPTSEVEYPCTVCGKEAGPYKGTGRKPTKCPDHKRGTSTVRANRPALPNDKLAAQAADALVQLNGLAMIGLMTTGFNSTASAMQLTQDGFRQAAYEALLTDPALCRSILRAGTTSGKVALIIAYGMMLSAVVPTALVEAREKRAAREEAENR